MKKKRLSKAEIEEQRDAESMEAELAEVEQSEKDVLDQAHEVRIALNCAARLLYEASRHSSFQAVIDKNPSDWQLFCEIHERLEEQT